MMSWEYVSSFVLLVWWWCQTQILGGRACYVVPATIYPLFSYYVKHHSFHPFYSIRSHTLYYFLNWQVIFTTSIDIIFGLPLPLFIPTTWINSFCHCCINCSPINITKQSQITLPCPFINKGHPYLLAKISHFESYLFFSIGHNHRA